MRIQVFYLLTQYLRTLQPECRVQIPALEFVSHRTTGQHPRASTYFMFVKRKTKEDNDMNYLL
jgi:hypothetical protein